MKSDYKLFFTSSFLLLCMACSINQTPIENTVDYSKYRLEGAEISNSAQSALIQHLTNAIEEGGTEYAIQFCNLKAIQVIDSISKKYNCRVSRITDRNRNPDNSIKRDEDKSIWNYYKNTSAQKALPDTLMISQNNLTYYRPIKLGLPACLRCHGKPGIDIDNKTIFKIDSLYPADLAKNYESGDLRGLWKIEFSVSTE